MRCSVCHQDYKQSDIIDNYFVKDTTEATSTSDEKAAQVCPDQRRPACGLCVHFNSVSRTLFLFCVVGKQN